jgi:hypothetical protein
MSVFTLLIDVDNKQLLANRFGGVGSLPNFDRGDTPNIEIGFLKYNGIQYDFVDYSSASVKLGIGATAATPTEGQFLLTWNGITSNAISYNTTTVAFQAALAPAVSATIAAISGVDSAWDVTMTTAGIFSGTTAGLGGDALSLYPASSVLINTARLAASGVAMKQIVRLVQRPAAFQDSWSNSQTTGGATLTLVQQGSATESETYSLEIEDSVYAGQYNLLFGTQAVGISFNATADQIQSELAKLTSIGTFMDANGITQPNVRVSGENGKFGIAFVGNLAQTNITTSFSVNDSALYRPPYKTSSVTLLTSQIENFLNSGITGLTLEIELVDSGKPQTLLRKSIEFNQNDLIVTGSAIPAAQASYYTSAEANSIFVEDSTSNVDATNRRLKNSGGTTVIDYEQALFGASGMVNLSASQVTIGAYPVYINSSLTATGAVSFGGGMAVSGNLGFYGTTPIAQPSGANVVSNVISLGLIASSATYGVLPQSLRTLTTVTFFGPVTVGSNDVNSTTVALAGVKPNDVCLLGLPINITEGITLLSHCVTDGQVNIDLLNVTGSQKIQTAATYRITVIGY